MTSVLRAKGLFPAIGFLIPILGILSACRGAERREGGLLRLSNLIGTRHIVQSPFQAMAEGAWTEASYPVDSYPLDDAGENPFGIKRRLSLGNVENRILFSPPRSEYAIELVLPEDPVLDFAFGIIRDRHADLPGAEGPGPLGGVDFLVLVEIDGRKRTLFQHHLTTPPAREERTVSYIEERIDLPKGGRKARLTLLTGGDDGLFAYWHNPVILDRSARPPTNVILVSLDTLRADHVGAYGYERPTTPAIDALAREGVVFENVYSGSPWTLPAHVSMLSGLDGVRHGVFTENDHMNPDHPTLAGLLRARGYACLAFTGGGFVSGFFGLARGFDSYGEGQGEIGSEDLAGETAKQVMGWLETHSDLPFFLFIHTYQIHSPYNSVEPFNSMFLDSDAAQRSWDLGQDQGGWAHVYQTLPEPLRRNIIALYDGSIRATDEILIKPLVERLRSRGLLDRTLLIVTSDHGEEFYDHRGWGHSHTVYDELIRVPLVVRFPGGRHAGRRAVPIVRLTDLVPTILEELGVSFEKELFDGTSLLPVAAGKDTGDRPFVAELAPDIGGSHNAARVAVGEGRRKLILHTGFGPDDLEFFAVPPPPTDPLELFDLKADPGETVNLASRAGNESQVRLLSGKAEDLRLEMLRRTGPKKILPKDIENHLRALGYIK